MNILKALEGLSAKQDGVAKPQTDQPAPPPQPTQKAEPAPAHNVMASVIARHEQIANRVKTGAKK